jgi:hypothetical protein
MIMVFWLRNLRASLIHLGTAHRASSKSPKGGSWLDLWFLQWSPEKVGVTASSLAAEEVGRRDRTPGLVAPAAAAWCRGGVKQGN